MAYCSEPRKVFSNLSDLRERPQFDVFGKLCKITRINKILGLTIYNQLNFYLQEMEGKVSKQMIVLKKLRLELGPEACDAHKALQNITTSTKALRNQYGQGNICRLSTNYSIRLWNSFWEQTKRSINWALKFFKENVISTFLNCDLKK